MRLVLLSIAVPTTACCCVSGLFVLAPVVIFKSVPKAALVVPLALLPLLMYGIASAFLWRQLQQTLDPRVEPRLHDKQGRSLTLAGFSLTALAILLRFYGEQVAEHEAAAISLAFSLAFFIAVYLLLRYRMREWSDYFSDGLMDSGLWCILVSLAFLFWQVIRSACAVGVICVLILGFIVYTAVHLAFYVKYARKYTSSTGGK